MIQRKTFMSMRRNRAKRSYLKNDRRSLEVSSPRSGTKKVAGRETSGTDWIKIIPALKVRAESFSARLQRAQSFCSFYPDVSRPATFSVRRWCTKQFSQQLLRLRFLFLILLISLNACSSQSAADKLRKELQTVSSWVSTSHMVGEALQNGKVPNAYAARTLEAAGQNLQEESRTLEKSSDIPAEGRANAQAQIARLQQIIGQLKTSVEGKDTALLSKEMEQLALEEQSLKSSLKGDSSQQ